MQYFEKGRIEDHSGRIQYGLLVDELHQARVTLPVGGDSSTVTYATINDLATPARRIAAPDGFEAGVSFNDDGSVFIPFSADLSSASGHNVSQVFWEYMQREDFFPAGWLHDIGLPLTEAIPATVDKGPLQGRQILVQALPAHHPDLRRPQSRRISGRARQRRHRLPQCLPRPDTRIAPSGYHPIQHADAPRMLGVR